MRTGTTIGGRGDDFVSCNGIFAVRVP